MKKLEIINPRTSLVDFIALDILKSSDITNNIVVFPDMRLGYYLKNSISEITKTPAFLPQIFSLDDFVQKLALKNFKFNYIDSIDMMTLLYKNFYSDIKGLFNSSDISFDNYFGWGKFIISDFEELRINNIKPENIKVYDFLISDNMTIKNEIDIRKKYKRFSELYKKFYDYLLSENRYSRAMIYSNFSESMDKINLNGFENIIFAGFFISTESEKSIFKSIYKLKNSHFIYIDHPLLKNAISFLDDDFESDHSFDISDNIRIRRTFNRHEEIFALKNDIREYGKILDDGRIEFDSDTAVVIPDSSMILPLVENMLYDVKKFNISAGFSAKFSPVFSLLKSLSRLVENSIEENGRCFYPLSYYIKFLSHPYIKNLKLGSDEKRTYSFLSDIEAHYSKTMTKFIELSDLKDLLGDGWETVDYINKNILIPFERIENIKDFISKVISLTDFLIKNSLSSSHPYWLGVIENIMIKLSDILERDIALESFRKKKSYFVFLDTIFDEINCPFAGSPIEGLQCIGFLETRGLKFKNLFILDMIDSVMPPKSDFKGFISDYIRKKLDISDLKSTSDIYRYYFENMVRSAQNVFIYHTDNRKDVRSPLVERIVWGIEKETDKIDSSVDDKILTPRISFKLNSPEAVGKTDDIKKYLKNFSYSASSLLAYSDCELKFYYGYLLRLNEKEVIEDDITNRDTGTIIHAVLHQFFKRWNNRVLFSDISDDDIKKYIDECVNTVVDKSLDKNSPETHFIKNQILKKVFEVYQYFNYNRKNFSVLGTEIEREDIVSYGDERFNINAKSDLIVTDKSQILIIDFKTSSTSSYSLPKFKALETNDFKSVGSLQLPFYILTFKNLFNDYRVFNASIMLLGSSTVQEDMLYDEKHEFDDHQKLFEELIKKEIYDIINSESFNPTDDSSKCLRCEFKTICYG